MPRVKQIALSDPPSQEPLEGRSDSALPLLPIRSLPPTRRTLADYNLFNTFTTQDTRIFYKKSCVCRAG
jgi:hypothetical protein